MPENARRDVRRWTLLWLTAVARSSTAAPVDSTAPVRQSAPLVVANRTLIVLRGPIAGYSARERVANTLQRIEEVLESATPTVTIEDAEESTRLLGGKIVIYVTRIDIDPEAGETPRLVARETAKRLETAVDNLEGRAPVRGEQGRCCSLSGQVRGRRLRARAHFNVRQPRHDSYERTGRGKATPGRARGRSQIGRLRAW